MKRLVLLPLIMLLACCTKSEPVRIGFLAGTSGRVADLGVGGRNGAMLAVEQANAAGGIGGRPVELVIRDDAQNPETARAAVAELIARKLEVIIGPMTSSMAVSVLPQVNASQAILVSPTVTTTNLTGIDDHFLRVTSDTRRYAAKGARYHFQKLGHRTASVIYDLNNAAYSESWYRDFKEEFERLGGKIVLARSFRSGGDAQFSRLAREVLAPHPDALLIIANAVDAALICQQARKLDPHQALATSEWCATERFVELAGAAAEGAVIAHFIDRDDRSPRFRKFVTAYRARFGEEPGFAGLAGYDACQVVLEAARRRKGRSMKQTIMEIGSFQGTQQIIRIDRFGDADRATYVSQVSRGGYRTLE